MEYEDLLSGPPPTPECSSTIVCVEGRAMSFYDQCDCGWKSRTYRTQAMANIAAVNHISTVEYMGGFNDA